MPLSAAASAPATGLSAELTWNPSTAPTVTGYNVYYGGASHQYTNSISAGNWTNAVIPGLAQNTPYFFAATAYDSNGNESAFSNEGAFSVFTAAPGSRLQLATLPINFTGDPMLFSLGANAPVGATINPISGLVYWTPGPAYASTTNYINVMAADTVNPALSIAETLVVLVGGNVEFQIGATAVSVGQSNSLPLTVASSSNVTNVQMTLAWPGTNLLNPTLTFMAPIIAGSLENRNNQLVIQLQTAMAQPLTGTIQVAELSFQAAPGQPSNIFGITATAATANTADGSSFDSVPVQAGEVVVVGNHPLLCPQANRGSGRALTLYANLGTYQLQSTTSLTPPISWSPLMTCQQTNIMQTVSLDSIQQVVFYRLQQF